MGFGAIGDLIAHAGLQDENPAVFQRGLQFAFEAEQDMALRTPMVGNIARRER